MRTLLPTKRRSFTRDSAPHATAATGLPTNKALALLAGLAVLLLTCSFWLPSLDFAALSGTAAEWWAFVSEKAASLFVATPVATPDIVTKAPQAARHALDGSCAFEQTMGPLVGQLTGGVGQAIALVGLTMGVGVAVVRNSVTPALMGVSQAGMFFIMPSVLQSLMTCTG